MNDNLPGTFLELARQHAAAAPKQGVGGAQAQNPAQTTSGPELTAWCPSCAAPRFLAFDHEDRMAEYYRCKTCGGIVRYGVR